MPAATKASRKSDWMIPASLILLGLVPAIAGASRLGDLANGAATADNARFFAMPLPIILHIIAVIPYSLLGALQFSAGFRRRHRTWHRVAGRVLGMCGLMTAITGIWMTLAYTMPAHDGVVVYGFRMAVGIAMAAAIVLGIDAVVRRRDFEAHEAWMIRSYALGMGAGTQVLTHLPYFILVGGTMTQGPRAVFMAGAWLLNALVAERIIRRKRAPRPERATRPRASAGVATAGAGLVGARAQRGGQPVSSNGAGIS